MGKKVVDLENVHEVLEHEFRQTLKKVRKENGYTQETLGKKSNIIRETIARIESGIVSPQINTIIKILEPIGYKLDIVKIEIEEENINEQKNAQN